jgi:3-oxoacyl-[acyl-carrier protein] reductase
MKKRGERRMNISLSNRVAIVTGAARGLGRIIAQILAESGAHVVIADIQEEAGQLAASELMQLGVRSTFIKTNVALAADCRGLIKDSVQQFGHIDILVNNASICPIAPIPDIDEQLWDDVIDINLKGTFLCSQAVAEVIKERPAGRIISIASISAHTGGSVPVAHYASSKGGVISMTRSFATYLAPHGCTVNVVAPGPFKSDLTADWDEEVWENFKKLIPAGRIGTAEEVANAVLFLASDLSSFITGEVINVNGGLAMR